MLARFSGVFPPRHPGLAALAAGLLLAPLAACQTPWSPASSLEEAKKVTARFGGSFTPPPMPRSTTTSTKAVTSTAAVFSNKIALLVRHIPPV